MLLELIWLTMDEISNPGYNRKCVLIRRYKCYK
uniref:Uncharacterized protein n=1 Tax=Tetranychus urticae TaxID=32264 RepID=T1JS37_TETUR